MFSYLFIRLLVLGGMGVFAALAVRRYNKRSAKVIEQHKGDIATLETMINDGDEISVIGQVLPAKDARRFDINGATSEQGALVLYRAKDLTKTLLTVSEFWLFDDNGVVKVKMPQFANQIEIWQGTNVVSNDGYVTTSVFEGSLLFVKGRAQWMNDADKPVHPAAATWGYRESGNRYLCIIPLQAGTMILSANSRFYGSLLPTGNPKRIPHTVELLK
jgi:hypothetical protein